VSAVGELDSVFADDDIAVIDKPSGLLSCPGRDPALNDSVQTRVPRVFTGASGPILAHRLDQPTSGLMVVGLHAEAHRALRKAFEARAVDKVYDAVVVGDVRGDAGVLTLPFRLDVERRPYQIYDEQHGKIGITEWTVVERGVVGDGPRTRLRLVPRTGRTHQLRVHCAHERGLGCAIAGDALYGDARAAPRLMLHATELSFAHPRTGVRVTFSRAAPFVFTDDPRRSQA
jgi:tRNA pseudouridine32 synthase/23S rRNA pseudouridine746 synthase